MPLFIIWSVVLMALSLMNFRRAKVMTSVFIGVLLLQMFLQVALPVAMTWHDCGRLSSELVNICSAAILLMFLPNLGFFVFAACRDFKHWWALSAAGAVLTCLWFFMGYLPYFIRSQA